MATSLYGDNAGMCTITFLVMATILFESKVYKLVIHPRVGTTLQSTSQLTTFMWQILYRHFSGFVAILFTMSPTSSLVLSSRVGLDTHVIHPP